jgi:propionyl-CoA synthetase
VPTPLPKGAVAEMAALVKDAEHTRRHAGGRIVDGRYTQEYTKSIREPEEFWGRAALALDWVKRPTIVVSGSASAPRWFADGVLNTCHNAVDRHVAAGRGDAAAVIYDSPVAHEAYHLTYSDLRERVARFAGGLRELGVGVGDRVVIYMPMIPETLIAMLACARLGAVHSVVFGGFAAQELATRVEDAKPKVIVWASCGIEPARVVHYAPLLEQALRLSSWPVHTTVVHRRPQSPVELVPGRDHDWGSLERESLPTDCVPVAATDPLYILYTSGTTGKPKGVVRDNGGHDVALAWSMKAIYDVGPGDVFWAASDMGWVVGHSYIVYAPLLAGATTVIYEGKPVGTPDAGAFWRVVAEHGVKVLFTAPTAIRAIRREDPTGALLEGHDISSFKALFLAGERLDPDTWEWAGSLLGVPVVDHWWQTETGWAIVANCLGLEALRMKPGSPTKPVPGYDLAVLDADGRVLEPPAEGTLALRLPLPPGALTTLWGNAEGFTSTYLSPFPGYYFTGDSGRIDEDGYVYVMGRVDDIINVAGHRLSTGRMEEVLAAHPDVAECAVVGVHDDLKGQSPLGLVVLKAGADRDPAEVSAELVRAVREQIGPVAAFKRAVVVAHLPKTRSGKILRSAIRKIADGVEFSTPATIEDASVLTELREVLQAPE